jgi:hypothetical protein
MAQLQLALIGESQQFMDSTNKPLRQAFEDTFTPEPDFARAVEKRKANRKKIQEWSGQVLQDCPAGPLGKLLVSNCPGIDDPKMRRDAVSTFGFAGHVGWPGAVCGGVRARADAAARRRCARPGHHREPDDVVFVRAVPQPHRDDAAAA